MVQSCPYQERIQCIDWLKEQIVTKVLLVYCIQIFQYYLFQRSEKDRISVLVTMFICYMLSDGMTALRSGLAFFYLYCLCLVVNVGSYLGCRLYVFVWYHNRLTRFTNILISIIFLFFNIK